MLMRAGVDIAALRRHEFGRLDRTGCTYLDYAGAALYPESLVRRDARRLAARVTGNPHSESGPSRQATAALDEARALTLEMLDADPRDYEAIFTPNAERIGEHVERLTASLLDRLTAARSRVTVYGPHQMTARGGTIAFNVIGGSHVLEYETVERAARERGIAIRGGCFCNPGAAEHAFGIDAARAHACLKGPFTVPRFRACLGETPVGGLRASIGLATCSDDLDRLAALLHDLAR